MTFKKQLFLLEKTAFQMKWTYIEIQHAANAKQSGAPLLCLGKRTETQETVLEATADGPVKPERAN